MRRLAQTNVLKSAGIAALATALLSYPRLAGWTHRPYQLWYLESVLFFCSLVLWSFVFAWHKEYSGRAVFALDVNPALLVLASATGLIAGALWHWSIDPVLRQKIPEEYPLDASQWLAMTLFHLSVVQLLLVFAPFAWLLRLFRSAVAAGALTVCLGALVFILKYHTRELPPALFAALCAARLVGGTLCVVFYARGGALLVWWWSLLVEARFLFPPGNS